MKKKCVVLAISAAVLVSSCDTYAGAGAASGAYFGSILGSAIGGIADGPYGSDVGTLIGMAGGAVVGAAVGSAADQSRQADQRKYEEYKQEKQRQAEARRDRSYQQNGNSGYQQDPNYGYQQNSDYGYQQSRSQDDSGFDPNNGGDDRIDFDGGQQPTASAGQPKTMAKRPTTSTVQPQTVAVRSISLDQLQDAAPGYKLSYNKDIELRNALFNDADRDGQIRAGEECKISFEIMNNSEETLYDVYPTVIETTGNKHIHISPSLKVENIAPHKGVRYTATVYGDSRLKDGEAIINVSVTQGNKQLTTDIKEFKITTMR